MASFFFGRSARRGGISLYFRFRQLRCSAVAICSARGARAEGTAASARGALTIGPLLAPRIFAWAFAKPGRILY